MKEPPLEPDPGCSSGALGKLFSLSELQEVTAATSRCSEGLESHVCRAPAQAGPSGHGGGNDSQLGRSCRVLFLTERGAWLPEVSVPRKHVWLDLGPSLIASSESVELYPGAGQTGWHC